MSRRILLALAAAAVGAMSQLPGCGVFCADCNCDAGSSATVTSTDVPGVAEATLYASASGDLRIEYTLDDGSEHIVYWNVPTDTAAE